MHRQLSAAIDCIQAGRSLAHGSVVTMAVGLEPAQHVLRPNRNRTRVQPASSRRRRDVVVDQWIVKLHKYNRIVLDHIYWKLVFSNRMRNCKSMSERRARTQINDSRRRQHVVPYW